MFGLVRHGTAQRLTRVSTQVRGQNHCLQLHRRNGQPEHRSREIPLAVTATLDLQIGAARMYLLANRIKAVVVDSLLWRGHSFALRSDTAGWLVTGRWDE